MTTPTPPPGFRLVAADPVPPPGFKLIKDELSPLDRQMDERVAKEAAAGLAPSPSPAQNLPFVGSFADEMAAGLDAGLGKLTGGTFGANSYAEAKAYQNARQRHIDANASGLEKGAAVAGGIVAGLPMGALRPFAGTGTMTGVANGAVVGAGAGALQGLGEGDGLDQRLENAQKAGAVGLVGGGVLGGVTQRLANRAAATPANSVVRDADAIGVQLPQFVEGGRAATSVASKLGSVPFAGDPINQAVRTARDDLGDAAERIADNVAGRGNLPQQAGEAVRNAMTDWSDDGARAIQDRLYAPITQAMQGQRGALTNTAREAGELIRQQDVSTANMHNPALRAIEEAVTRPGGLTFEGMQRLRTQVGLMMDNALDPNNRTSEAGLKAIYRGLSQDMEAAIQSAGNPRAVALWQRANRVTAQIAERRQQITSIIGARGDKSGEGIVDRLVTMASTKSSADVRRLGHARRVAGADAWRQLAGNAIARLGRNQSNEFSAAIFLKNYGQLSPRGRQLLFGSTGDDNLLPHLDALANVSRRLATFDKLGNPSGTGGVVGLLTALGGIATGNAAPVLGSAVGGRAAAVLLSRPAVVRAASRYAQALQAASGGGGSAAVSNLAAQLARAIATETGEDPAAVLQTLKGP